MADLVWMARFKNVDACRAAFDQTIGSRVDIASMEESHLKTLLAAHRYNSKDSIGSVLRFLENRVPAGAPLRVFPRPYFDFCVKSGRRARAVTTRDGIELIGIYHDLPLAFADLFGAILSVPDVLRDVGNRHVEEAPPKRQLAELGNATVVPTIPVDPTRRAYAMELALYASRFVVLHELAHHVFGHNRYLKSKGLVPASDVIDFEGCAESIPDTEIHRALEMDADSFACFHMYRPAVDVDLRSGSTIAGRGVHSLVFKTSFAIQAIFLVFGRTSPRHPPREFRRYVGVKMAEASLDALQLPSLHTEVARWIGTAFATCELAIEHLASDAPPRGTMVDAWNEQDEYFKTLESAWNSIRRELQPFSRGVLAPEATPRGQS